MPATLIPCKDCGTQISPRATSCPKCGAPVIQRQPVDTSTHEKTVAENLKIRSFIAAFIILVLIALAIHNGFKV